MEDFSDELQKLSDEQLIGLLARQFTAAGFGPEKLRLPLSDEVREEIYEILYTAKFASMNLNVEASIRSMK